MGVLAPMAILKLIPPTTKLINCILDIDDLEEIRKHDEENFQTLRYEIFS